MSYKKFVLVISLMPIFMAGGASADIASVDYVNKAYTAGNNVSVSDNKISVANADANTAGVAKMGEVPYMSSGAQDGSAMMWVE